MSVTLYSKRYAGKSVVTSLGTIQFDERGKFTGGDEFSELSTIFPVKVEPQVSDVFTHSVKQETSAPNTEVSKAEPESDDENIFAKLNEMTVSQMRKFAKENDIDISGLTKRDEILPAISEAILQRG